MKLKGSCWKSETDCKKQRAKFIDSCSAWWEQSRWGASMEDARARGGGGTARGA